MDEDLHWIALASLATLVSIVVFALSYEANACDFIWFLEDYQEECA